MQYFSKASLSYARLFYVDFQGKENEEFYLVRVQF